MALDNGNYAAQPNNRILWNISSYTTNNDIPDYKVQSTEWNVENKGLITEDSDKMFYEVKKDSKRTYQNYKEFASDLSYENKT